MNRWIIVILLVMTYCHEILAGPGGKIAKELFESPMGKILGVILFVILLPVIIFFWYKKNKSIRESKKILAQLSKVNFELFDEINLKNRVTDVFTRVHKGWSEMILDDCEEFMTHWYRQNQQTVFLDEWNSKGLMNICTIQKINSIKPLHVRITDKPNFEGSRIMYAIDATMEDYLVSIEDSSVIEGNKGFRDVETVWTLMLVDSIWKVDNIEQSDMVSTYLKMDSQLSNSIVEKLVNSNA